MKLVVAVITLFLVQTLAENGEVRTEEESALLDEIAPEEQRACIQLGQRCAGDCQCCGKWSYCKCPLLFGQCSCVVGDAMICKRKKRDCKTQDVMNTPRGGCFSSSRRKY